jgi:tRNAThr (cytosine32-N3)-methyltransferase
LVAERFNSEPEKWWDLFYRNNTTNFFKNRKWLQQEFPILTAVTQASSPPTTLLEVGAGAGNTAFPILAQNRNPHLKIHAVDFSKKAVELIRDSEHYDPQFIQADVWDVTDSSSLPPGITEGSVDVVLLIFIFSALSPDQWRRAVWNVYRMLKPDGEVCLRDYGRGDLAQVRFRKGRWMEDNFYVRGDGTRVYFFEKEELARIWRGKGLNVMSTPQVAARGDDAERRGSGKEGDGVEGQEEKDEIIADELFEVVDLGVDRRLLVNRQRKLKMYRCWLQGRFQRKMSAYQPKLYIEEPKLLASREIESSYD